jgi:hypothetical protein
MRILLGESGKGLFLNDTGMGMILLEAAGVEK